MSKQKHPKHKAEHAAPAPPPEELMAAAQLVADTKAEFTAKQTVAVAATEAADAAHAECESARCGYDKAVAALGELAGNLPPCEADDGEGTDPAPAPAPTDESK